ncbi:amidohydrolase family protein [Streptomyces sp. 4F14]|uniref:amidohydrolase family protein n=1 Tax=Streptomyces sp. 4F14 TaxID=3394380 RepID=UPI003A8B0B9E
MKTILVRGGHVLTMDPGLGDLPEADVLVRDGRIVDVGPRLPAGGAEIVEAGGRIVVPGFVDTHQHSWQGFLQGLATDWSFPRYMRQVRGGYGGCLGPDEAYLGSLLGGLESINAGVTTVVDHAHLQTSAAVGDALLRGLWDSGIGGWFAYALQNAPDWQHAAPTGPDALNDLLTRTPDPDHDTRFHAARTTLAALDDTGTGRLRLGVALPETAAYLPLDLVRPLLDRVRSLGAEFITAHWNAALHTGQYVSTLAPLVDEGYFAGPTVLSHCNQFDDDDLDVMARARIGLATTPSTEGGMALGPYLARRLVERGGAAGIGLDSSCYTRSDLLAEARALLLAERRAAGGVTGEPLPARAALELLTSTGARAAGLHAERGTLTPGKRADITVVAPDPLRARATTDPAVTLVFYTGPSDIETVLVDGVPRKRAGKLVGVDTKSLAARADQALHTVRTRYATLPQEVIAGAWQGMF